MYLDLEKRYQVDHFKALFNLYACSNEYMLIGWWIDPATNIEYVIFYLMGK
jgi:hypothetical protein